MTNKLVTGLLKIVAKKALPPLYAEMIALNCDFGAVDVLKKTCVMGNIETGEIKKQINFDFNGLKDGESGEAPKFMGMELDEETAASVVQSMLIRIIGGRLNIIVNSKIAGKITFDYSVEAIKKELENGKKSE